MEENVQTTSENTTQATAPVSAEPTLAERNLIAMRKKLEREEAEKKEFKHKFEEAQRALQAKQATESDDDLDEKDKKIQAMEQRISAMEVESVTSKMSDFNELVTDDNLKTLERLYPDEYNSLRYNPDIKSRAKIAYNMLKNYGVVDMEAKKNKEKIEENKKKPTAAALGAPTQPTSPLSRLEDYGRRTLTDEEKEKIMKEVARKRRMS